MFCFTSNVEYLVPYGSGFETLLSLISEKNLEYNTTAACFFFYGNCTKLNDLHGMSKVPRVQLPTVITCCSLSTAYIYYYSTYDDTCTLIETMIEENYAGVTGDIGRQVKAIMLDAGIDPAACPQPAQSIDLASSISLTDLPSIMSLIDIDVSLIIFFLKIWAF